MLLGLVPARGTSVALHAIEPNTNVSAAAIFDTASCASSNNSSVTRKRSAAMPKLMSATCMAGARATAAAVVAPMKPPSQSESGGRRIDTRKTESFCFLSEAAKVSVARVKNFEH